MKRRDREMNARDEFLSQSVLEGRNEMKVSDEPLGRNCRRTLLTQLTDRFFG
jgi:hypothetical protein